MVTVQDRVKLCQSVILVLIEMFLLSFELAVPESLILVVAGVGSERPLLADNKQTFDFPWRGEEQYDGYLSPCSLLFRLPRTVSNFSFTVSVNCPHGLLLSLEPTFPARE